VFRQEHAKIFHNKRVLSKQLSVAIKNKNMSHLAFARKYRPSALNQVVGQQAICALIANALDTNRIAQAYLFTGPRGTGKTTLARIVAKSLNCKSFDAPTSAPCGKCSTCMSIAEGNSLDVREIDGATNNGVDAVKSLLSGVATAPAESRFKVYIIDEVHMLSTAAFNALLKTLEEPPSHVKFIFATTDPMEVPATVMSRCQRLDLRALSAKDIQGTIQAICRNEGIVIESEAVFHIAKAARGGLRDALTMLDQMASLCHDKITGEQTIEILGMPSTDTIVNFGRAIAAGDLGFLLSLLDATEATGVDPGVFCGEMAEMFKACVVRHATENHTPFTDEIMGFLGHAKAVELMAHFGNYAKEIKRSVDRRSTVDTAIVLAISISNRERTQPVVWPRPPILTRARPQDEVAPAESAPLPEPTPPISEAAKPEPVKPAKQRQSKKSAAPVSTQETLF